MRLDSAPTCLCGIWFDQGLSHTSEKSNVILLDGYKNTKRLTAAARKAEWKRHVCKAPIYSDYFTLIAFIFLYAHWSHIKRPSIHHNAHLLQQTIFLVWNMKIFCALLLRRWCECKMFIGTLLRKRVLGGVVCSRVCATHKPLKSPYPELSPTPELLFMSVCAPLSVCLSDPRVAPSPASNFPPPNQKGERSLLLHTQPLNDGAKVLKTLCFLRICQAVCNLWGKMTKKLHGILSQGAQICPERADRCLLFGTMFAVFADLHACFPLPELTCQ